MMPENPMAVVITEEAGRFPDSIGALMPGRAEVMILAQSPAEPPAVFAMRVARKIAKLSPRDRPKFGAICFNARTSSAWWTARAEIARSLLSSLDSGAELVLTVDESAGRRGLQAFFALVDELNIRARPAGTSVRLRFEPDAPRRESRERAQPRRHHRTAA